MLFQLKPTQKRRGGDSFFFKIKLIQFLKTSKCIQTTEMVAISRKQMTEYLKVATGDRDKSRNEIAFTFVQAKLSVGWLSKEEITQEMKRWKKLRKDGKLKVYKENNKTVQIQGQTWYMMCLTVDTNYDPIAMLGLDDQGIIMSGFCYFFKHECNRDMTANYIGIASDNV